MEKSTKDQIKSLDRQAKALDRALAAHEYSTGDLDLMWSEYHSRRRSYQMGLLDFRFQLKKHLTSDEWVQVFEIAE